MPQERYRSLNDTLQERFGEKIYKLSLNGGCTCPNRDGTLGSRGCIFCSAGGSGDFASSPALTVTEQIEDAKRRLAGKEHLKSSMLTTTTFRSLSPLLSPQMIFLDL